MTLRSLERGGSGVTMGAYLAVMQVLGVERELDQLAKADPVGRELQDMRLPANRTAHIGQSTIPTASKRSAPVGDAVAKLHRLSGNSPQAKQRIQKRLPSTKIEPDWITKSGFASSDALAKLIKPRSTSPKKGR
jgi:hypothetical protein